MCVFVCVCCVCLCVCVFEVAAAAAAQCHPVIERSEFNAKIAAVVVTLLILLQSTQLYLLMDVWN